MDGIDEQVGIARHQLRHVEKGQAVCRGILGEHAVLEGGQSLEVAIAERCVALIEILQDRPMPDRVQHHAVLHQPDERGQRQFTARRLGGRADAIEIAQDRRQIHRQVGTADVGIALVDSGRPHEIVGRLGPFAAIARHACRRVGRRNQGPQPPRQGEMLGGLVEPARPRVRRRRRRGTGAGVGPRHRRRDGAEIELVGALVIDDEVGPHRRHLLANNGFDIGRADALAAGVQNLETEIEALGRRPHVEPVADIFGIGGGKMVRGDRRRRADEGDAHRLRRAHEGHRRPAKAVGVGDQPVGQRCIGHEAVPRVRTAIGRVVDEQVPRRVPKVAVAARLADEGRVPRLEHVGTARALGVAALLDPSHELVPFGWRLAAIGQRRRIVEIPVTLDAGGQRDLVQVLRHVGVVRHLHPARDALRHGRTERDRDQHQQGVLQIITQWAPTRTDRLAGC